MDRHSDRLSPLERHVLRHLISNPAAKDTREGIRKWWIAEISQEPRPDEMQEALDELTARGWVVKSVRHRLMPLYALNTTRTSDIEQALKE